MTKRIKDLELINKNRLINKKNCQDITFALKLRWHLLYKFVNLFIANTF